jgi:hypothetical protein
MIGRHGTAQFSCHQHNSPIEESWGVTLRNIIAEWPSLSAENITQPTWNPSSFLCPSTTAASASTFILASHVSAHNLKGPCPPSLLNALHEDFVNHST